MDGARRLGRNAMILSIVAILGGIAAIAATIALNWGRESIGTRLKVSDFHLRPQTVSVVSSSVLLKS